ISSAVDNDLPASKYLRCKSLPEMEEIKLCDNNNGSIRLFKFSSPRCNYVMRTRKLRSANEIQIAGIRISLCETKVRLVTTTIGSHSRLPPTSVPRPEGRLIQWSGNNSRYRPPASFAYHRNVAARKWCKIQLEDQAKISYYCISASKYYCSPFAITRHAFSKHLILSLHREFSSTPVHTDIKGTDEFHLRISESHFSDTASFLEDGVAFLRRELV
ncbi:hypothetical protein ALC60_10252, partial [Trachymyrmex zeteki]